MTELSPTTKALLRAAKGDGPSAASRAKILSKIASGTGGAAVGAAAVAGSAKLLAAGALFGSALTVGIAAVLLQIGAPKLSPDPIQAVQADSDFASIAPAARASMPPEAPAPVVPKVALKHALAKPVAEVIEIPNTPPVDPLAREAELVAEARGALVRGEPDVALGALRATEALPRRAMEPEELSLHARALHAVGHDAEAVFVEDQLRERFPDNALSR